jgi:predicted small secreted protein
MMKKLLLMSWIFLFSFLLTACGPTADGVSQNVQKSMQEKFDTDAEYKAFKLKVKSAQFVKESDKKFKGVVKVEAEDGTHDIPVQAIADGSNVIWEADPNAFTFLAAFKLNESLKQIQQLLKGLGISPPVTTPNTQ